MMATLEEKYRRQTPAARCPGPLPAGLRWALTELLEIRLIPLQVSLGSGKASRERASEKTGLLNIRLAYSLTLS